MLRKISFVSTLSFWASLVLAQSSFTTLGDSVQLRINSNGSIGIDLNSLTPSSHVTQEPNNHFLKQAGLYLVAQDENGLFHTAIQYLQGIDSFDFWPGPVNTLTQQTGTIAEWDNVWSLTKEEVENHKTNWNTSGYEVNANIAYWPANGPEGFAPYLAPFVDYNGDNIYNPELGDYPAIRGKKSAYCIFNDLAREHKASLGSELGIEVQLMAYQLENSDAIYLEYYIINRSSINYETINVGFVLDGQCGNPNDNFAGTFQNFPQSIFIYNADNNDEDYFGTNLPFVSATFLNENMTNSIAFDNTNAINGSPSTVDEHTQIGQGNWKNGQTLQQGGTGVTATSPASYIFNQSPESTMPWIENQTSNTAGTRTIIGTTRHATFSTKDFIKIDIALNFGTYQSESLRAQTILNACEKSTSNYRKVTSAPSYSSSKIFDIYPNPILGDNFTINSTEDFNLEISNYQGVICYNKDNLKKGKNRCNISLPTGIYHLKLITKKGVQTIKLCITH